MTAFIKLVNANQDDIIQHQEIGNFMKSQDNKSIFNNFLKSIKTDISVEQFKYGIRGVAQQAYDNGIYDFDLTFKKEEVAKKYEQIKSEMQMQSEFFSYLGYRFKSDEEFNAAFSELISKYRDSGDEAWGNVESGLIERCASTTPVDWMVRLNTGRFYSSGSEFQNIVFEDVDLSEYTEAFKHITFNENTFAKVSPKHLPAGFNPQEVLEKGKTIGLGIDQAHTNGYTGEGISYAIIDSGTLDANGQQHNDIHFKEYNVSQYATQNGLDHFHGRAVSYIAQEIAPNADCYYYAAHNGPGIDAPVLDNLKQILEKNKTLPDNQKIRFVSMSMPLYGGEEAKQVVAELEAQGVWVYYSGCPEDENRGYLSKKDPNGDPNDFDNYEIYAGRGGQLFVNSGNRTVPDPSSTTAYRHDSMASQSWSIPVIAGYYTLACQADPTMTKEKFMTLAEQTAQVIQSTEPNYVCVGERSDENNWVQQGRTEETVPIKVIDINALLKVIEEEKNN